MRRLNASLLVGCTLVLIAFPLAGTAQACPDQENPCDLRPYSPKQMVCDLLNKPCE
ncbi:MAG TPA: hypothetical protein VJ927_01100 [Actinomycetota bacterium]|nr:hypothetical protein [Actinomycetota bacterium]